jgi:hypothetical protein
MVFGTRINNYHIFLGNRSQDFHMIFCTQKLDFRVFFGTSSQDFHILCSKISNFVCSLVQVSYTVTRLDAIFRYPDRVPLTHFVHRAKTVSGT